MIYVCWYRVNREGGREGWAVNTLANRANETNAEMISNEIPIVCSERGRYTPGTLIK